MFLTTFLGLWKGLRRQFFGLGGVIAGYVAAVNLYKPLAEFMSMTSGLSKITSFITIFFICKIMVTFIGWKAKELFKSTKLSLLNRAGGASVGALKGLIMVLVIVLALTAFLPSDTGLLRKSALLPFISSLPEITLRIVPEDIRKRYNEKVVRLRKHWKEKKSDMQDKPGAGG
jgi:membrane protein required for colicin V production